LAFLRLVRGRKVAVPGRVPEHLHLLELHGLHGVLHAQLLGLLLDDLRLGGGLRLLRGRLNLRKDPT
jgi:hypothetical protein